MMDYKLSQQELLASFRPSEPNTTSNTSPPPPQQQHHPPLPTQTYHIHHQHQYTPSQTSHPPSRNTQHATVKQQQVYYQTRPSRQSGPTVKFNYKQAIETQHIANNQQRQSMVRPAIINSGPVIMNSGQPANKAEAVRPMQSVNGVAVNNPIQVQNQPPLIVNHPPGNQRAISEHTQPVVVQQQAQLINVQPPNQPQVKQQKHVQHQNAHYQQGYLPHAVYPHYPLPPPYLQQPYPNPHSHYPYYPQQYPPYPPYPYYAMPPQRIPPPLSYQQFKSLPQQQIHRLWMQHQQLQKELAAQNQPRMKNYSHTMQPQHYQYRNHAQNNQNYPQPTPLQQQLTNNQQYPQQYAYPQQPGYEYPQQPGYEYPPQYYQQQGFTQYPAEYQQAGQGQSTLWQQRFFYLYQKYQTFYEKYEVLNKQGEFLADQFLTVDSEQEWLALKQKYDSLVQRMNEVKQLNGMILQQMQDNIQQNLKIQNGASIKQQAGRVWQHRYHELLQQYQSLSHHYAELQSSSMAHNDMDQNERVSMMNQKYSRLEAQYNHVVQELQNSQNVMQLREEHQDLLKYTQQLQGYIEQLQSQNNNLMRGMKTSVDGSKMLQQTEITQKLVEKQNQIKNLSHIIVTLQEKVKNAEQSRPKSSLSKDGRASELENQIQEMTLYCNQLQQKLSMKDYQINGLNDKLGYMQEQLHIKQEEVSSHSKLVQQKLSKIEEDLSRKTQAVPAVQSQPTYLNTFSFEQDYQNRIKQYQRSIQSKNYEIKSLQDRITESQTVARKISLQRSAAIRQLQDKMQTAEEQARKKLQEKDARIRTLQQQIKNIEYQNQRKYQDKDNSLKVLESQMGRLKEEIELRLVQKDAIIKGLRDTTQRITVELRDKNSEISRIKSPTITPHLHSPNQSFIAQTFRHDEQLRVLTEQLQRRNDQIGKLKKQRDSRNKQFKDLQMEYELLQEQNNKRRIEINNLKRQSVTIENLQLQAENLRNTANKRNQEISQLKNSLFQKDRIRMELQSAKRQLQKQSELSRIKNRQIEQLTERNYELQEKIRQKEFKLPVKQESNSQRNVTQEMQQVKEELRRKQIEVNRLKAENDELQRSLRRQSEQLQSIKLRYPNKLKSVQQQLSQTKLKLTMLEKKYTAIESRAKEAEEFGRKTKANAIQQQNKELSRMQQNFSKHTSKLQEQNQILKQKIRTYEIKLHDLQIEADSYASRVKELETFKDEHAKKLVNLNQKLDIKQEQLKNVKQKTTNEVLKFRKKESRVMQLQAALKSRDQQARQSQKQKEILRNQLRALKKQYQDYKQQVLDQIEYSTHKEMQNLNKQLNQYQSKFALQSYNFDFKSKDKKANQVFERTVIYQLKEENDFLRRELEGRGSSISLEKMRINQMQQEALLKSKNLNRPETQPSQEELDFYRQKNKELEQRVNSHIAVNKNLKERIEQLSNNKNDGNFNKQMMMEQLQKKIFQLQSHFRRLQQQNELLKLELSKKESNQSSNELYQLQINDMNRTIAQISLHRDSLIQQIKVVISQRNKFQSQLHQLQKSANRNENKIAVQQSQIQRLKDMTRAQKSNSLQADLKLKMEGLMSQLAQKETALSEYYVKASHFQSECLTLTRAFKDMEYQLSQIKQNQSQNINNEQNEKLRNKVNALQATINSLQGSIDIMRERISQLQGEAEYYRQQAFQQKGPRNTPEETYYFLELMRSNYLQLQSLAGEISIESEVMAILAQRIGQNCRRGLESCQYLHEIFAN